jgi:hypothetical protein
MSVFRAFGAIAALAITGAATAGDSEYEPIYVGMFANLDYGDVYYEGAWSPNVTSGQIPGWPGHTWVNVDVPSILDTLGYAGFAGVTITDAGFNMYGELSPGADMDLLAINGLSPDNDVYFLYDGPNTVHQQEPEGMLAYRVRQVDSFDGAQDKWHSTPVSLGRSGVLRAMLLEPYIIDANPAGPSPSLVFSEAGASEFFHVHVLGVVPAPGPLALLAVAGLVCMRSRKRN